MMPTVQIRKSNCSLWAQRRGGSLAEVYPAEVGGKAEMDTLSRWNYCRNDLAEVSAEVGGSPYAKSLISLMAEVWRKSNKEWRRASPASLRFAAPPIVGQIVPISYFEIDEIDLGILRVVAGDTSSGPAFGGAP